MPKAIIVILGITGDLSKRKLLPALYHLLEHKKIREFSVVGVGRKDVNTKELVSAAAAFISKPDDTLLGVLERNITYVQGNLDDAKTYEELKRVVGRQRLRNVIIYLATLPDQFGSITKHIQKHGLDKRSTGWTRVVFEKPFGNDLEHARRLNASIKEVFREEQIYRIDHFLGKELVQNISVLRFSNTVLEPLWSKNHIDHVQIILNEDIGVGTRGAFYDHYGALKDVVQNHMLQLLALTAMEAPSKFNALQIRNEKFKVLQSTRKVSIKDVVLGQYKGYGSEKGVSRGSSTETFAALKVYVDNLRWQHVPFYLKTGKFMKERGTTIYIQFEEAPGVIFDQGAKLEPNHLVISIQPNEGFYLTLNAKRPGNMDLTQVKMDFCHGCVFGANTPEAYETLLENVLIGDQSVFVRSDEVEEGWRVITPLIQAKHKVAAYAPGEHPLSADAFIEKDGRTWFS